MPHHVPHGTNEADLDLVPVFATEPNTDRAEAATVKSLLESGGFFVVVRGDLPEMPFSANLELCVPRSQEHEAREFIKKALAAGPRGAAEAEREGES